MPDKLPSEQETLPPLAEIDASGLVEVDDPLDCLDRLEYLPARLFGVKE